MPSWKKVVAWYGDPQLNSVTSTTYVSASEFIGPLVGTSSFATSASYAVFATTAGTASYSPTLGASLGSPANNQVSLVSSTGAVLSSVTINNVVSSSYALTASYAENVPSALTASYALTASSANDFNIRGSLTGSSANFSGNVTASNLLVNNTITAQTLVVQVITSSTEFITGSTKFGSQLTDTHQFTGSVTITGSLGINGVDYTTTSASFDTRILANSSSIAILSSSFESLSGSFSSGSFTGSFTGSFNGFFNGQFSGSLQNLRGQNNFISVFSGSNDLTSSIIYQSGSSIAINETNFTSGNPEALYVFQTDPTSINVITGKGNLNNYLQLNIQNTNQGISASSDVVATANNGNEFGNYIDMGINSENFATNFIGGPNDAYLYSTGSNLHIGNASDNGSHLQFFVGGTDAEVYKKLQLNPAGPHEMTGSLRITGSLTVTNGITGSLFGTSSWAVSASHAPSALTSSYALTASFAPNYTLTSSFTAFTQSYLVDSASFSTRITNNSSSIAILSSSFLTTSASYASLSGSFRTGSYTGSFIGVHTGSFSGSFFGNGAGLTNISASAVVGLNLSQIASGSVTASVDPAYGFKVNSNTQISGSTQITGSLGVTGSVSISGSTGTLFTANVDTLVLTGSLVTTGSMILTGSMSVLGSVTASLLGTASYAVQALTSSYALTSSNVEGGIATYVPLWNTGTRLTSSYLNQASNVLKTIYNGSDRGLYLDYNFNSFILGNAGVGNNTYLQVYDGGSTINIYSPNYTYFNDKVGIRIIPTNPGLAVSGSLEVTGPGTTKFINTDVQVTGSLNVTAGITGSLFGTASYALQALSSSYALSASHAPSAVTASYALFALTSSNALTASSADNFVVRQNITASNALVTGTITAQTLNVQVITSSVEFVTGSTRFGSQLTDTHQFTGSVSITGSLSINNVDYTSTSASFDSRILANSSSVAILSSSYLASSASFDTRILANSSSIATLSGSFLLASASFDTRINNLTESVFTHIVTNNGASNYIIDGVAKPKLSFVPGATYRFNTSGVVGSHPFKFSTSPNGPTEYTTGVTSGSNYIQIEVNYDTPTTLYYYCTIHSGMGNEINTLRIDTLVTTASFNSFTSSYYTDSASFSTRATNNSSSIAILSGSFLTTSASFENVSASYSQLSSSFRTGSYTGSFTGSFLGTGSNAISASYAFNADLLDGKDSTVFATTGSNVFVGNQTVTGSLFTTGSNTLVGNSILSGSVNISGSTNIVGTTNFSNSSTTITGSLLISGSTTQIGNNTLNGNTTLSGSIIISGSTGPGATTASVQIYGDIEQKGYIKLLPVTTNINTSISASYIYVSGSTNDLYFSQNGSGYNNVTRLRWIEGNLYTGLLNGGLITSQSSTVYQISSGSGIIVNLNASFNENPYPTIQYLNWSNLSASIAPLSASYDQSFVAVDNTGNIFAQGTPYSDGQYNTAIPIGVVLHQNRSTINGVQTFASLGYGWKQRSSDFIRAFGPLKLSGLTLAVSGSSTGSLLVGSGTAWSDGRNYSIDPNNPSYITDPGTSVSKIFRYRQSGSNWVYDTNAGAGYGAIDPSQYSNNGVLTSVGAGNWSIQRVFWFPNSVTKAIYVYYGNAIYATEADAIANVSIESFVEAPNTAAQAIYLGAIVISGNGVFTNTNTYKILPGGLFRNVGGSGGGGSVVTQTLSGLSDVAISGPTNLQPLAYSTTAAKWINTSTLSASIAGNADTATTASYANTASYVLNAISSSYALSSSYSVSSSYAVSASHAPTSVTASYALQALTASNALTASSADNFLVRNNLTGSNALFSGTITAQTLNVQVITSSVEYVTGSTRFGSDLSNTHQFTGSVTITGSLSVNNSPVITTDQTSSMSVLSSSYALTASYAANVPATASYALQALSSSYSDTASIATTASYAVTAAYAANVPATASYALQSLSSSYALTASFALNGGGGGISAVTIADEGVVQGSASFFDFVGATVSTSVTNGTASINIAGGAVAVQGAYSVFTQSIAATTWSISHAVNSRIPVVEVYDNTFNVIIPTRINNPGPFNTNIYFDVAQNGYAIVSTGGDFEVSGSNAILNQTVAATTWSFQHDLQTQYPVFTIFDSNNDVIIPQRINAVDTASAVIYFSTARTGKAVASVAGPVVTAQTASLAITASYAISSSFASFATSASYALSSSQASTASYVQNAQTASYVQLAQSASYVQNAQSASYVLNAVSASYSLTSSYSVSSSFASSATSASYAITSSFSVSSSYASQSTSASYALSATSASYALSSTTASYALQALTASNSLTASSADNFVVRQNITASNGLFTGTITAQTLVVQTVTSSVVYSSGSNIFGNQLSNTQQFTGSVTVTGSLAVNNSPVILTNQTSSMTVLSSSFASTASYVQNAQTASYVLNAQTASYVLNAQTASYVQNAQSASYVLNAVSASYSTQALSSSYSDTASIATTASYAVTAAYAANVPSTASYALQALSSSYALTASFALNGGGGGISAVSIADEGTLQGSASYFDFTGAGVTATVTNGTASINITGTGGGGQAGLSTTFTQSVAADPWTFIHNLNTRTPLVQVYDTSYNQITPQYVSASNANTVIIGFGVATAGYAIASNGGTIVVTGSNVILNQSVAATTWSFDHNLNTQYPIFQVFNSADEVVIPEKIVASSITSSFIYFPTPISGKAVASVGGLSGSISASYAIQALTASYAMNAGGGISSITIADEGTLIGTASYFDFIGNNITASVSNGTASITIIGATGTSAFTQSTAAATWSFVHNLNTFTPLIQAYTSTYNQLIPNEIVGIDPNVAEIRFDYAQAGYAVASNGGDLTVSGSTARLDQTSAAVTWSFAHNLNSQYVNFEVYDANNFVIIPANIKAVNSNNAELYFATPTSGVAIAMFSGINGAPNAVTASYALSGSNFYVSNTIKLNGTLTDTATVLSSVVGSNNLFTQATGSFTSAFFKYTAASGSNARSGEVMAVWNGSSVEFTDNSTADIGTTSAVTGSIVLAAGDVQFNMQTNTSGWRIKSIATFM